MCWRRRALDEQAWKEYGRSRWKTVFLLVALLAWGVALPPAAGAVAPSAASAAASPAHDKAAPAEAAKTQGRIRAFNDAAVALYEAVRRGDNKEMLRRLNEAETRFRELPLAEVRTVEGIEALAGTMAEMKRAAAAVTPDPERREKAATALRLAADELAHPERPLWHQYRPLIADDIDRLEQLTKGARRLPAEALPAYERLAGHYRLIRTAVLLRGEPWIVERSDAVLTYAGRLIRAANPDPALIAGMFAPLREAMAGLFPPDPDAPSAAVPVYVPPPWGFSAAIGSLILTVLAWNGWRRFRFERARGPRRNGPERPREDAASRWLRR